MQFETKTLVHCSDINLPPQQLLLTARHVCTVNQWRFPILSGFFVKVSIVWSCANTIAYFS